MGLFSDKKYLTVSKCPWCEGYSTTCLKKPSGSSYGEYECDYCGTQFAVDYNDVFKVPKENVGLKGKNAGKEYK